jgi:hypothetical protein
MQGICRVYAGYVQGIPIDSLQLTKDPKKDLLSRINTVILAGGKSY